MHLKNPNIQSEFFTFLANSKVMWVFLTRYIDIEFKLNKVTYITKALTFLFNAALANFFISITSIYLVLNKNLAIV